MSATMGRRAGSARLQHLTPGELENKTKSELFLSPGKNEYIPAHKGRMPVLDAINTEASTLQDAELDMRINSKFDRVFGNAMFECEDNDTTTSPKTPGAIKMNNLFGDTAQRPRDDTPNSRKTPSPNRDGSNGRSPSMVSGRKQKPERLPEGHTPIQTFSAAEAEEELELQRQAMAAAEAQAKAEAIAKAQQQVVIAEKQKSVRREQPSAPPPAKASRERTIAAWETEVKHLINDMACCEAVHKAAPAEGLVRCYVRRVKNFFGTHCSFQMHLDKGDVFLLAARRRKKSKVSSYVISQDLEDLKRDTDNCLAKLKANFVGTEYTLWCKSENRDEHKGYADEQLHIHYKQTALTTKGGPRQMIVCQPLPESGWSPSASDGSDGLANCIELAKKRELAPYLEKNMAMMCTKPPEYDEHLKAYTLDFKGRVKEASVKNFQLVIWDHSSDRKGSDVILQFGKIEEDVYALDFAYPMNALAAFSIALASIDTKLCYAI